ncbi:MAG: hypothetical protein P8Y93_05980 [Acidobacteriota bacterium]
MLRGTLAFLVLVLFAVLGTELRGALLRRGLRAPAMEGISFLLVGFALGGSVLGLFPEDMLHALRVVVLFGLAWIGLVFGVQVELRIIRRLAPWHRRLGLGAPLVLGVPVAAGAVILGLSPAVALGLAAVAMAPSPTSLEGLARGRAPRDRDTLRLLKLVMAFAGVPAVCVFAVATAVGSPLAAPSGGAVPVWHLGLFIVTVGVLVGYVLVVLVRGVREHIRLLTLALGTMCLVAGSSAVLGLSALPSAAVAGAVLVNRCVFPHRMLRVAHSLERPMLVALLVLVGASWSGAAFSWAAFALMTVVRCGAAVALGAFLDRVARARGLEIRTPGLGLGLLPQGELALGLLVAGVTFFAGVEGILEGVVAAIVVNNVIGQLWMRQRLFEDSARRSPP